MASELYVETLKGLTSGANANKVIVPAGQTLECASAIVAPGSILQTTVLNEGGVQTSTSTDFADSNVYIELTSAQANSDFFMVFCVGVQPNSNPALLGRVVRQISGSSDVVLSSGRVQRGNGTSNGDADRHYPITYIDSPDVAAGTTVKYMFQFATSTSGNQVRINDNSNTTVTLMEIAG